MHVHVADGATLANQVELANAWLQRCAALAQRILADSMLATPSMLKLNLPLVALSPQPVP
jgi:hypothetical protein